jgi:predicted glycosyltransferase
MKVIMDILTPKQFMFIPKIAESLEKRGHTVQMVSRRYREVSQLVERMGLKVDIVGEHGGGALRDKLLASAERIRGLVPILDEAESDVAVSFSSPELARTSFGLGVPHISINDSPHAVAVAKLSLPLSRKLLTPKIIPKSAWAGYGIDEDRIVRYNALDPWVWLKDFEPDEAALVELGLSRDDPIVTVRVPEMHAAYLLGSSSSGFSSIVEFVKNLKKLRDELQIVVVPRYREQVEALLRLAGGGIRVCEEVVDGPSLTYYSDVFIGAGGTMSAEAALLGTPAYSSYPGEPYIIESYLVDKGLLIRETDYGKITRGVLEILDDPVEARELQSSKAQEFVSGFEDPVEVIVREIENVKDY